jgi:hypothetical protein
MFIAPQTDKQQTVSNPDNAILDSLVTMYLVAELPKTS